MIYEIAKLRIDPAKSAEFVAAVDAARPHFEAAEGFVSFALQRVIEVPGCYHLLIGWETVDHHMVTFRAAPGFLEWRRLASPFFVEAPEVVHVEAVI